MVKSKSIWSEQNHFGPTKTVLVTYQKDKALVFFLIAFPFLLEICKRPNNSRFFFKIIFPCHNFGDPDGSKQVCWFVRRAFFRYIQFSYLFQNNCASKISGNKRVVDFCRKFDVAPPMTGCRLVSSAIVPKNNSKTVQIMHQTYTFGQHNQFI